MNTETPMVADISHQQFFQRICVHMRQSAFICVFIFWILSTSPLTASNYFIVFLVDAPHLNYSNNNALLRTIAKHPSNGSKNGDVGHAWIYLQGIIDGRPVYIEGGHSGELGCRQAKYFDGVMNYIEYGYANPTSHQMQHPRFEPNPIKYLWEKQQDGFFQWGSGRHTPTFAAKIDITPEQFQKVLSFLNPENYCYADYALTDKQCSSFIAQIGELLEFPIDCLTTIWIDQTLTLKGETFCLWQDPRYAMLTFASPDVIEASLKQAVYQGRAQYALPWYLRMRHQGMDVKEIWENIVRFPSRCYRYMTF